MGNAQNFLIGGPTPSQPSQQHPQMQSIRPYWDIYIQDRKGWPAKAGQWPGKVKAQDITGMILTMISQAMILTTISYDLIVRIIPSCLGPSTVELTLPLNATECPKHV